jgi:hypothetical protein
MSNVELTKNYERLADFQMNESQKFYSRANFFIAAEGIFFNAFITAIVGTTKLEGYLIFAPIVICAIGISLNIIYILSSYIQLEKLSKTGQILNKWLNDIASQRNGVPPDFPFSLYESEFSPKITPLTAVKSNKTESQLKEEKKKEPRHLVALVYKWAPTILIVGWSVLLMIYILQIAGIKLL